MIERGERAQPHSHDRRDNEREYPELGRHEEGVADDVRDFAVALEGDAEIALQEIREVRRVLNDQWLIEVVAPLERGIERRRPVLLRSERPARDGVHQDERDRGHGPEDGDEDEYSA